MTEQNASSSEESIAKTFEGLRVITTQGRSHCINMLIVEQEYQFLHLRKNTKRIRLISSYQN